MHFLSESLPVTDLPMTSQTTFSTWISFIHFILEDILNVTHILANKVNTVKCILYWMKAAKIKFHLYNVEILKIYCVFS